MSLSRQIDRHKMDGDNFVPTTALSTLLVANRQTANRSEVDRHQSISLPLQSLHRRQNEQTLVMDGWVDRSINRRRRRRACRSSSGSRRLPPRCRPRRPPPPSRLRRRRPRLPRNLPRSMSEARQSQARQAARGSKTRDGLVDANMGGVRVCWGGGVRTMTPTRLAPFYCCWTKNQSVQL